MHLCAGAWWWLCISTGSLAGRVRRRVGRPRSQRPSWAFYATHAAFVVALAWLAQRQVTDIIMRPSATKDAYIASTLHAFDPATTTRVVVLNDFDWWGRTRRIGSLSLVSDLAISGVAAADVRLVARGAGVDLGPTPVTVHVPPESPKPGDFVIDLAPLRDRLSREGAHRTGP